MLYKILCKYLAIDEEKNVLKKIHGSLPSYLIKIKIYFSYNIFFLIFFSSSYSALSSSGVFSRICTSDIS